MAYGESHGIEFRHRLADRQACQLRQHSVVGIVGRDTHIHLAAALHHGATLGVLREDDTTLAAVPENGVLHHEFEVYIVLRHHLGNILAHHVGHLIFLTLPGINADEDEHHRENSQRHPHHQQQVEQPRIFLQKIFL